MEETIKLVKWKEVRRIPYTPESIQDVRELSETLFQCSHVSVSYVGPTGQRFQINEQAQYKALLASKIRGDQILRFQVKSLSSLDEISVASSQYCSDESVAQSMHFEIPQAVQGESEVEIFQSILKEEMSLLMSSLRDSLPVHQGYTCHDWNINPIVGYRYYCAQGRYSLWGQCEQNHSEELHMHKKTLDQSTLQEKIEYVKIETGIQDRAEILKELAAKKYNTIEAIKEINNK